MEPDSLIGWNSYNPGAAKRLGLVPPGVKYYYLGTHAVTKNTKLGPV